MGDEDEDEEEATSTTGYGGDRDGNTEWGNDTFLELCLQPRHQVDLGRPQHLGSEWRASGELRYTRTLTRTLF